MLIFHSRIPICLSRPPPLLQPPRVISELIQSFLVTHHLPSLPHSFLSVFLSALLNQNKPWWWQRSQSWNVAALGASRGDRERPKMKFLRFAARGDRCTLVRSAAWCRTGRVFFLCQLVQVSVLLSASSVQDVKTGFLQSVKWKRTQSKTQVVLEVYDCFFSARSCSEMKPSHTPKKREQRAPANTPEWQLWFWS